MAITTYTELKAAVANWLHRGDLTSIIPDFIAIGEKRLMRDIANAGGHRVIETSATITPTANAAALPADYLTVRSVVVAGTPNIPVRQVPIDDLYTRYNTSGTGHACTISGATIALSPDSGSRDIILYYYATPDSLSDSVATNALFAIAPDVYLYSALMEASAYIGSDPSKWMNGYQMSLSQLMNADKQTRWGSSLSVRAA